MDRTIDLNKHISLQGRLPLPRRATIVVDVVDVGEHEMKETILQ